MMWLANITQRAGPFLESAARFTRDATSPRGPVSDEASAGCLVETPAATPGAARLSSTRRPLGDPDGRRAGTRRDRDRARREKTSERPVLTAVLVPKTGDGTGGTPRAKDGNTREYEDANLSPIACA